MVVLLIGTGIISLSVIAWYGVSKIFEIASNAHVKDDEEKEDK